MTTLRRTLATLFVLLGFVAPAPALADDAPGGDANAAVARNETDGSTVVRTAFSIRKVNNGVVDQSNEAYALASCMDCRTVAVAFQVVLVRGEAHTVVPVNRAVAVNDRCAVCVTYASATQFVLGVDGPVRFTAAGRQRLAALAADLRTLDQKVPAMTLAELHTAVTAAKNELVSILNSELVVKNDKEDRTEAEDPYTTVEPAEAGSSNARAGEASTAPTSTSTVSGPAGSGQAVTTTASRGA